MLGFVLFKLIRRVVSNPFVIYPEKNLVFFMWYIYNKPTSIEPKLSSKDIPIGFKPTSTTSTFFINTAFYIHFIPRINIANKVKHRK